MRPRERQGAARGEQPFTIYQSGPSRQEEKRFSPGLSR